SPSMTPKQPLSAFTTGVGIRKQVNNAATNNNFFIFFRSEERRVVKKRFCFSNPGPIPFGGDQKLFRGLRIIRSRTAHPIAVRLLGTVIDKLVQPISHIPVHDPKATIVSLHYWRRDKETSQQRCDQ